MLTDVGGRTRVGHDGPQAVDAPWRRCSAAEALRTYAHVMPSSGQRTCSVVVAAMLEHHLSAQVRPSSSSLSRPSDLRS
ncbi:MAG: hypothetical protein JWN77_2395 [Frankiales bacterium]|nr:hypothetical protein [Frankiales bacterium]